MVYFTCVYIIFRTLQVIFIKNKKEYMFLQIKKIGLVVVAGSLLAACVQNPSNIPVNNLNGLATSSSMTSSNTDDSSELPTGTRVQPQFDIPSADSNASATSYNPSTTGYIANASTASCNLNGKSDAYNINIPRDSDNKPIYARINKGIYTASTYQVQKGDTLFLIGYITNRSANDIANYNKLTPGSVLTPGSYLVVNPNKCASNTNQTVGFTKSSVAQVTSVASTIKPNVTTTTTSVKQVATTAKAAAVTSVRDNLSKVTSVVTPPTTPKVLNVNGQATGRDALQWPAKGKIISTYSNSSSSAGNNGLVIKGEIGDKIVAAADGIVSYAGKIQGYGNIVLLKNSKQMITLYAYNSKLLVKNGESVKRGQTIALMGNTGTSDGQTKLYFEVRIKGKAVDPLKYLPKR